MPGSLLDMARKDAKKIATSVGWEEEIQISSPDKSKSLSIKGWHTKHKIPVQTDGGQISTRNAHILISEDDLIDYPVRDEKNGRIDLKNHFVDVADSTGVVKNFVINESHPSETFGLIVCILGEYTANSNLNEDY